MSHGFRARKHYQERLCSCKTRIITVPVNYNEWHFCARDSDCPEGLEACQANEIASSAPDINQTGICVPKNCDDGCPSIGNGCSAFPTGFVSGECENNYCNYTNRRANVRCMAPDSIIRDKSNDKKLVFCNSNLDCPNGLDYCHANPFVKSYSNDMVGVCAPRKCDANDDCPAIGDRCGQGSVLGTCSREGKCDYDSPLVQAFCDDASKELYYFLSIRRIFSKVAKY